MRFVLIGTPGDSRTALFQHALGQRGLESIVISYIDLIAKRVHLADIVDSGAIVRIDSPGREFDVERMIVALCDPTAAEIMSFEKGRIWYPYLWYLGFANVLSMIAAQLLECPAHYQMNNPSDIATMFDKTACHTLLEAANLPVPRVLQNITSYDTLIDAMWQQRLFRVFIKLAHGSSASGAVAYQWNGERHRAITTVEMVDHGGAVCLYNSRRIRTYENPSEIRALINALCCHRVHVEQWIPKSAHHNKLFDLRIVMIDGEVRHTVVRLSHSPMTNLHLLNERSTISELPIPAAVWAAAQKTCQSTASMFPDTLYCGIDLMFDYSYRRHYIVEVNAFGDLLHGTADRGESTYDAEIEAALGHVLC